MKRGTEAIGAPHPARWLGPIVLLIGANLLSLGHRMTSGESQRAAAPELAAIPPQLGDWVGSDLPVDPAIVERSGADAYLNREYVHRLSGSRLRLWINFSHDSSDQKHYPTVCLRGSGWRELRSLRETIELGDQAPLAPRNEPVRFDAPLPAGRMLFDRDGETLGVAYWYYLIEEDASDATFRWLSRYWRGFLRGRRNASLTVEIFMSDMDPGDRSIDRFAGETARALDELLPDGVKVESRLGADS